MRTRSSKKNSINVVTLGCSKNIYDSEVLMGQLKANGKEVTHEAPEEEEGNIVVINTCGFIDNAKQESIDTILHYADKKQRGEVDHVYVTGCLSERYKPDLEAEITDVDAYFGTRDMPLLLKTLGADYKHELVGERMTTTPKHFAYLKIAEGCDRPCSFCAIPLMRGGHKSTPIENLVIEAEKLAAKGVKELILIAQDLTYYGLDLYKERRQVRKDLNGLRLLLLATWGVYPIAFLLPQLGIDGADSFVGRQLGYSIADVLAKCLFGLLIYKIAREKSFADDESFAAAEIHEAPSSAGKSA
mgnify:CR=1 FL=1